MLVSKGTFTSRHVPMSVSLASNLLGHEGPYNFISDGCPQRLVDDMTSCLWDMSDGTYCLMREAMDPYCSQLNDLIFCHGKETDCIWDLEDAKTIAGRMLSSSIGARALTKARRAPENWRRCMPVVSFNGGRYDLQLIKPYLAAVGHSKQTISTQLPGSLKNTTQHHVSVQSTLDRRPMYYSQKSGLVESECKLNNVNPHIIRNQYQIQNQIEVTLNEDRYCQLRHYHTNTEF